LQIGFCAFITPTIPTWNGRVFVYIGLIVNEIFYLPLPTQSNPGGLMNMKPKGV